MNENKELGGWSIDQECYDEILNILPKNSTILELGSGYGTYSLSKFYNMISIEHNKKWLNKYNSTYIYAPLKEYESYRWYDVNILRKKLPLKYDLILVDGPPKSQSSRFGFLDNIDLFNVDDCHIIFDDVHRKNEYDMFKRFINKYNDREYKIFNSGTVKPKKFVIIYK